LFQIQSKLDFDDMTGGEVTPDGSNYYFLDNVPYVMYFDGARGLHGTYWHNKFGSPASRGCVNLTKADANWFFDFTTIGTWVYVWDPSGNTPTDPSAYGDGGA
jgi:lipoprotein-anchoring transpeptidase ErfK/SrfK